MVPWLLIFPRTRSHLNPETWDRFLAQAQSLSNPADLPEFLDHFSFPPEAPPFLSDLARLEWAVHQAKQSPATPDPDEWIVNPGLQWLPLHFRNLPELIAGPEEMTAPVPGEATVLAWKVPPTGEIRVREAGSEDLLALKMAVEGISPEAAAMAGGIPISALLDLRHRAAAEGLLLAPRTRIRRDPTAFTGTRIENPEFLEAPVFTLQWHVTQACDLHCRHCYDRSDRSPLTREAGVRIIRDLGEFCRHQRVSGQISFSGGNPLLYPHFDELYGEAAAGGFGTAILGNPAPRTRLEALRAIREPEFFQVSLEGLEAHNDWIRGPGHFRRTLAFLEVLRDLRIYSMVMLTLTKDNLDQVIPLAEMLRGRTDSFFFNRLSQVGEGANLQGPGREAYAAFLESYLEAAAGNPILGLKDNLTNIVFYQKDLPVFGGCTGSGCGAAFNFLTLLPDGEVHACRKFPSRIGNVRDNTLLEIYDSEAARRYRAGTAACQACPIRPVCGGCLAVAYGAGLDIFTERDPYCFMETK